MTLEIQEGRGERTLKDHIYLHLKPLAFAAMIWCLRFLDQLNLDLSKLTSMVHKRAESLGSKLLRGLAVQMVYYSVLSFVVESEVKRSGGTL